MDKLLAVYKRGGFDITKIHCDNEVFIFAKKISVNQNELWNTKEHVPQAE